MIGPVSFPHPRARPLFVAAAAAALLALLDGWIAASGLAHPMAGTAPALLMGVLARWVGLALVITLPSAMLSPAAEGRVPPWVAALAGLALAGVVGAAVHGRGEAWQPDTGAALGWRIAAVVAAGWGGATVVGWLPGRRLGVLAAMVAVLGLGIAWSLGPGYREPGAQAARVGVVHPPVDAPDLFLLTIDTWRADSLASSDAPMLGRSVGLADQLAATGLYFPGAVAPAPLTGPSHSTMLAGVPPWESGVLSNGRPVPDDLAWLPQQLQSAGYATGAFVSSAMLDGQLGFSRGFDVYDDDLTGDAAQRRSLWGWLTAPRGIRELRQERFERPGADTAARAAAWLATVEPDRPVFLWLHLYEPHAPYRPPDEVLERLADAEPDLPDPGAYEDHPARPAALPDPTDEALDLLGLRSPRRGGRGGPSRPRAEPRHDPTERTRRALRSSRAYLAEVYSANDIAGGLVRRVEELREGRPIYWAVAGDHGESLSEHNELRSHKQHVYDANVRVPLMVAGPGLEAGRAEGPVSTAGVAGTLATLAGLDDSPFPCLPAPLTCASSADLPPPSSVVRAADHGGVPARVLKASVREGDLKLVRSHAGVDGWSEWYDLSTDPHEITPLDPLAVDPALATTLTARADAILDAATDRATAPGVSEEMKEALRALGYVE